MYGQLNFDGSVVRNPRLVGVGGIICDNDSRCPVSYSDPAGVCTVNNVELMTIGLALGSISIES